MRTHTLIPTPIGTLTAVQENHQLIALHANPAILPLHKGPDNPHDFKGLQEKLNNYFNKALTSITLPLNPAGTPFQQEVWAALQTITTGTTTTYQQIALQINRPTATRAVANAIGSNPILVIVPCHRIIRTNGHIGGYALGADSKETLLRLER